MGVFNDSNPAAKFLASVMRCEDCEYPCKAKENSSQANCERHMEELLQEKKVSITINWQKFITIKRREPGDNT